MPNILMTGGSGFLGNALLQHEAFKEAMVVGRTRPSKCHNFLPLTLNAHCDLTHALRDIDVVVHLAARAHVMDDNSENPLEAYRAINTAATLNLANQAKKAGVKRFIFISTIKVLGEETQVGQPFTNEDILSPQDPYSVSKAEAEMGLKEIAAHSSMELVIIRPPLIYGKGVKGNFAKLLNLVSFPLPLPLGSIKNSRSLVSVDNLVDLICTCLEHRNARNCVFLVSDDDDISTPDLCRLLLQAGGYSSKVVSFPRNLLHLGLSAVGKKAIYERLVGSMEVDIEFTKSQLDWTPPFKMVDCIIDCWSDK